MNGTTWVAPGEGATVGELLGAVVREQGMDVALTCGVLPKSPIGARTNIALTGEPLKTYDLTRLGSSSLTIAPLLLEDTTEVRLVCVGTLSKALATTDPFQVEVFRKLRKEGQDFTTCSRLWQRHQTGIQRRRATGVPASDIALWLLFGAEEM